MDDTGNSVHGEPAGVDCTLAALTSELLGPPLWPACRPGAESAWWLHVPFAHWIVAASSPRTLVELGTHWGVSYAAFCNAVTRRGLSTRCYAVDTWRGDPHAGLYGEDVFEDFRRFHDQHFSGFSTILRCTFDAALGRMADRSIDLLHIDGLHTYEAVRHDFESWVPKLSNRGVVLFHDTNVRRDDFGVWRLWAELRERYPGFEFLHGFGLGILAVGENPPPAIAWLAALDARHIATVRTRFSRLGELVRDEWSGKNLRKQLETTTATASRATAEAVGHAQRAQAEAMQAIAWARTIEARLEEANARVRVAEAAAAVAREELARRGSGLETPAQPALRRARTPFGLAGARLYPGTGRLLRDGAKLAWWTATLQLPRKLQERRASSCNTAANAPVAPSPQEPGSVARKEEGSAPASRSDPDAGRED